jgi:protein-S-isoprenylcysteine O-methyltransferase Ste14
MVWLKTLLFIALMPIPVLGWIPFTLARTGSAGYLALGPVRWLGLVLLLPGAALMLWCFVDFARRGRGTPAPVAPPTTLVIQGAYRWVRNPMYVGGVMILAGETVLWQAPGLAAYLCLFWGCAHLFVTLYEEPSLTRRFGEPYRAFLHAVPRWIPRAPAPSPRPARNPAP